MIYDCDENSSQQEIPLEILSHSFLQSPTDSQSLKKPRLNQKSYRKKVETAWAHENILKLIKEVEIRRCLWDAGCAEYKLPKESAWQEVADAIPASFNDCKGKWSNLITTFNCNLDKLRKKKSGQGTDEEPKIMWKYFKPMMFLETARVNQSTQSTSSFQLETATTDESLVCSLGFGEDLTSLSPSNVGKRSSRNNVSTSGGNKELKEMAVEALQSMRYRSSIPKDPVTAFGEYIATELRTLTPQQAAYAKSKLRRSFSDIMDEVALMVPQGQRVFSDEIERE